jgi:phosphoribosylanthranilate isomerase
MQLIAGRTARECNRPFLTPKALVHLKRFERFLPRAQGFMLEKNLIQIAGVIDAPEAQMLQQCGVRYLGFPLRLPVHREDLTEEAARAIIKSLAPPIFGVLITYLDEANEIAAFSHALGARLVQLHGDIDRDELKRLKALDPTLIVIKSLVIGMRDDKALEGTLSELSPFVDAFITDTFDPKTGASGATGKTHDWRVSRRLVELADRPIILAGGLTPTNVKRAIVEVRPAGVDSHTGVEDSSGRKSREKVQKFLSEAYEAFELVKAK